MKELDEAQVIPAFMQAAKRPKTGRGPGHRLWQPQNWSIFHRSPASWKPGDWWQGMKNNIWYYTEEVGWTVKICSFCKAPGHPDHKAGVCLEGILHMHISCWIPYFDVRYHQWERFFWVPPFVQKTKKTKKKKGMWPWRELLTCQHFGGLQAVRGSHAQSLLGRADRVVNIHHPTFVN